MRSFLMWIFMFAGLWGATGLLQAQALLPNVQERKLGNGVRILLVERSGLESVHARVFLAGGKADTGSLPAAAAELLARCLFGSPLEGEPRNNKDLEAMLRWEEGVFESIRLEKLKSARQGSLAAGADVRDLEMAHHQILERFRKLAGGRNGADPLADLWALQREVRVEADLISFSSDIPSKSLDAWSEYLADRLREPLLARFPLERQHMLDALDPESERERRAMDVALSTALSGQRYAHIALQQQAAVEALTWSAMRDYARHAATPERIVLVLVGGVQMSGILPSLQRTFGTLPPGKGNEERWEVPLVELLPDGTEARRIQANVPGEKRLFMGWRIPPITHPDNPILTVLAELLGGGDLLRLNASVRTHVPGGKFTNLLLIKGKAGEFQALSGLEEIIRGEVIRLQRGSFKDGEIRRAQRQVEADQVMVQEDAASLADVIGTALCQGGDWRLAFRSLQVKRDYRPQEIQDLALKYLVPGQSIVVMLEPDPTLLPQDQVEIETARVLTKILESKLENRGKVEAVVREALKQLRMLPLHERQQTLRLLQSQVKP